MGVHSQIVAGIDAAWTALADLLEDVTVQRVARGPYSPALGRAPETVSATAVPAAVYDVAEAKVNGTAVRSGDLTCVIRVRDLPARPAVDDRVVRSDGTAWTVVRVSGDRRYVHELQLRIG